MFDYQQNNRYFAQTGKGLEELARAELEELGAKECSDSYCGVYFNADAATMYRINYCGRIISRVLAPLTGFKCHSDRTLYKKASEIDWSQFLSPDKTFAVFASVSDSKISHSQYAALKMKDAIADYFRAKTGKRPNVETRDPDVWINLNIRNDSASVSFDTSGGSLHRRGYRQASVSAPLQETLAAAIIRLSGWPNEGEEFKPFWDPMCGSGTLLAEALMTYCRIPAAFKRKNFGFFHLPDFDRKTWQQVKSSADKAIRECPRDIIEGSDISMEAVEASIQNLKELPSGFRIQVRKRDFKRIPSAHNRLIVSNLPYGVRLDNEEKLKILYKDFGDFLKHNCKGSTAYILMGSKALSKCIGLKTSRRIPLFNGPLEVRLGKFEMY